MNTERRISTRAAIAWGKVDKRLYGKERDRRKNGIKFSTFLIRAIHSSTLSHAEHLSVEIISARWTCSNAADKVRVFTIRLI